MFSRPRENKLPNMPFSTDWRGLNRPAEIEPNSMWKEQQKNQIMVRFFWVVPTTAAICRSASCIFDYFRSMLFTLSTFQKNVDHIKSRRWAGVGFCQWVELEHLRYPAENYGTGGYGRGKELLSGPICRRQIHDEICNDSRRRFFPQETGKNPKTLGTSSPPWTQIWLQVTPHFIGTLNKLLDKMDSPVPRH